MWCRTGRVRSKEASMKVTRIVIARAAALAACGVLGMVPAAAQASSASIPTWTRQAPATRPLARYGAAMAYDAATGNVVLFGGNRTFGGTWTWDGTTWTRQHPATHPPDLWEPSMVYDAGTGNVVLYGSQGRGGGPGDTWVWNGTTWTQQHPATGPPVQGNAAMAYDAGAGDVVLFGGCCGSGDSVLGDTWTWNGTTWTQQHPATSPPAREYAVMAYDAATGDVVLFGGNNSNTSTHALGGTWTWDGATWTRQHPAIHPPARGFAAMAYDAATGNVVLFSGDSNDSTQIFGGTWTWDGTTWTRQHPATHPQARYGASMAYDAATGNVVLFGGEGRQLVYLHDTWTWG